MAYSKHTWVDKELITPEKLNNIENGIGLSLPKDQIIFSTTDLAPESASTYPTGTIYFVYEV